jgi:signal transduction histidine kinase
LLDETGKSKGIYVWEFQNTIDKQWYECRDQVIRWPDGRLVRMEVATNITKRMETENKLHRYQEHLEELVEERAEEIVKKNIQLRNEIEVRKRLEEELEASLKKLTQIDRTRSEFVDIASHELRTPMFSIKLFIDLMRGGKIGKFTEKENSYLDDINSRIEEMNRLINEMLDFTRTESMMLNINLEIMT